MISRRKKGKGRVLESRSSVLGFGRSADRRE